METETPVDQSMSRAGSRSLIVRTLTLTDLGK